MDDDRTVEEREQRFREVLLLTGTEQNRSSNWLNVIPEHVQTTTREASAVFFFFIQPLRRSESKNSESSVKRRALVPVCHTIYTSDQHIKVLHTTIVEM